MQLKYFLATAFVGTVIATPAVQIEARKNKMMPFSTLVSPNMKLRSEMLTPKPRTLSSTLDSPNTRVSNVLLTYSQE